jgi:hypothetical protein
MGHVQLYDGGQDGLASTPDNTLFATEGIFTLGVLPVEAEGRRLLRAACLPPGQDSQFRIPIGRRAGKAVRGPS